MNCPVCGSDLPAAVRYCPVCGTDVESVQMRAQQAAARTAPTQQMPPQRAHEQYSQPYRQPQGGYRSDQRPSGGHAVSMNSSMPPQMAGRAFDTGAMAPAPKWPYVLIALLVVLIVVVVLLIFRPWDTGSQQVDNPGNSADPVVNVGDDTPGTAADPQQGVVSEGPDAVVDPSAAQQGTQVVDPTAAANAAVYQNLSSYYGQLAGFDAQISAAAGDFNSYFLSSDAGLRSGYAASAASLYDSINANLAAVQAMSVPQESPYYATWQNIATLYNCLAQRIRVISEAWALSAGAADPNAVYDQMMSIIAADNVNGVNQYKAQYEELYPSSQPVEV